MREETDLTDYVQWVETTLQSLLVVAVQMMHT